MRGLLPRLTAVCSAHIQRNLRRTVTQTITDENWASTQPDGRTARPWLRQSSATETTWFTSKLDAKNTSICENHDVSIIPSKSYSDAVSAAWLPNDQNQYGILTGLNYGDEWPTYVTGKTRSSRYIGQPVWSERSDIQGAPKSKPTGYSFLQQLCTLSTARQSSIFLHV